jgi:putative transposase
VEHHVRRRNGLRYSGYDYAQAGAVFVTICTHNRQRLFGVVDGDGVGLSPSGEYAAFRWRQISQRFSGVLVDTHVIMPDHIHAILHTGADPSLSLHPSIGDIVRWFKSTLHADYSKGVRHLGWSPYDRRLWQRDYYDHIIRDERDLDRIRAYIEANPARWHERNNGLS